MHANQVGKVLTVVSPVTKISTVIAVSRNVAVKMVLLVIQFLELANVLLVGEDLYVPSRAQMVLMVSPVPTSANVKMEEHAITLLGNVLAYQVGRVQSVPIRVLLATLVEIADNVAPVIMGLLVTI